MKTKCKDCEKPFESYNYKHLYCDDCYDRRLEKAIKKLGELITTNYKCQKCGKQATIHYQTCQVRWAIIDDEIYLPSEEILSGEDSEYYCTECDKE